MVNRYQFIREYNKSKNHEDEYHSQWKWYSSLKCLNTVEMTLNEIFETVDFSPEESASSYRKPSSILELLDLSIEFLQGTRCTCIINHLKFVSYVSPHVLWRSQHRKTFVGRCWEMFKLLVSPLATNVLGQWRNVSNKCWANVGSDVFLVSLGLDCWNIFHI